MATTSILDDLGEEVTGIVAPVSLCMALTVALVRILNPSGESDADTVIFAAAYYREEEGDSAGKKLSGSMLNALIFVAFITAMTFVLLLLFKYGCVKCIYGYMGFAVLTIFFGLVGAIVVQLLRKADLHMDAISLCFILYNFSVVGMLGLFFWPSPILLKQGYLVVVGVIVAYIFTLIPEWTTWVLLVFMALYDLFAVLAPGGPLKALVELAIERQQELPALVYEARPARGGARGWGHYRRRRQQQPERSGSSTAAPIISQGPVAEGLEDDDQIGGGVSFSDVMVAGAMRERPNADVEQPCEFEDPPTEDVEQPCESEDPGTPLVGASGATSRASSRESGYRRGHHRSRGGSRDSRTRLPASDADGDESGTAAFPASHPELPPVRGREHSGQEGDALGFELPDSLKLGLGDFIFYSVLVGRAAFYDFMTVYAAYLAIIAGLGITLLLLALSHRALPALPISIALGVIFYFLTRLVLEPFIVPLTLQLSLF